MSSAPAQRPIACYHCQHQFEASVRAMSLNCPKCSRRLQVDDVVVKGLHSVHEIQTCGKLVVQQGGHVIAKKVHAMDGVLVEGHLEANVTSGGPVKLGPKAKWKGDCRAPSLSVALGAVVTSGFFAVPDGQGT